ncbi:prominin-1-A [Musca vetustissima]|uniref:prominin-1-A n=1 Tax=Musca vetustissima TaxID=27455 RepID=UPI002AB62759|nr:prominin-1-A [Musca vetustissima]
MADNETLPAATTTTGTYYSYTIPGMDISSGSMLFTLVSQFMGVITPSELPLGQVRQLLHSNLTLFEFGLNAIKVESGFIALMSIFMILAVVPILATCCWCCCSRQPGEDEEFARNAARMNESLEDSLMCRKSASLTTLWIVFILLSLSDLCIFYANSRLASTVEMTPEMIKSTVHDMEVFLKDTHLQIKHKLDNGFHVSVEKVVKDLEDVDVLLGEPIQAEISAHTGIELAYDSLATLSLANAELIYRVLMLQETVGRALKISQEASARMEELQIQLSVLQRQCTYRDRPLCDTLRIRSFEENGIIDALKTLQEDQTIFRMRYLGEIEFGATVKNLTSEVGMSRSIFSNFPQQVKMDTAYERNYTLQQLETIRHRTTTNAQMLTSTINVLLGRLEGVWDSVKPQYEKLQDWSNVYWTTGWVAAMAVVWILIFMLMAYCCFLCESNVKAGVLLFIAVVIICLSCIGLTIYGVLSLAIGGNAEVFLCKPLYDAGVSVVNRMDTTGNMMMIPYDYNSNSNNINNMNSNNAYDMLGKLFDKPGYVYEHEPEVGIIGELLRPDGVNRPIVNVSLSSAIRGCEKNEASYNVFQLDAFVNTTAISNLKQFPKVTQAIDSIDVSERTLLSLTQTIQSILESMLQTSSFNLTTYRTSIGSPTPEKDLATFIDQMQRVALQIQDVATSSRMTTLGSRSKRLQSSILQPLEQLQNEILYHLTALELQRDPWAKQVNQTLNHLRNIQEYLEKTAGEICDNQTRIYTERLKTYLASDKATMSSQLGDTTAKCRPFFDIFDANRIFLCRNMIDFINALWFFPFLTLLLWSVATPVGLNLITLQRKLTTLKQIRMRGGAERGRRRERDSSTSRERSTSSGRRKPAPLRRTATEETLDIDDIDAVGQQTPVRSRSQPRRPEPEQEDNWRSSGPIRAPSRDRSSYEREQPRAKPPMRRQGTEEFNLDDEGQPASYGRERSREPRAPSRQQQQERSQGPKFKPALRRQGTEEFNLNDEDTGTYSRERSQPRAPSSSRQQQPRIQAPSKFIPVLRRQGTEEFNLDDDNTGTYSQQRNQSREPSSSRLQPRAPPPTSAKSVPVLRRQGTEEFNLDDDGPDGSSTQQRNQSRAPSNSRQQRPVPPPKSAKSVPVLRRQGTEEFNMDNDDMAPYERERSQPRGMASSSRPQQRAQSQQTSKPVMRRRGTEEFNLDDEDNNWRSPQDTRGRSEPRRGDMRSQRSMTPVLSVRPDVQPAQPMPRTPPRLKSRVSLTTRAVANIVKNRSQAAAGRQGLRRRDTEDFEIDDDNTYSTATRQAVEAARRTPPRSAPPPPPPPANRFSDVRSVRWTSKNDDIVFEDCDSANPMYMIHDLDE